MSARDGNVPEVFDGAYSALSEDQLRRESRSLLRSAAAAADEGNGPRARLLERRALALLELARRRRTATS
jgi:hypothetical protein